MYGGESTKCHDDILNSETWFKDNGRVAPVLRGHFA